MHGRSPLLACLLVLVLVLAAPAAAAPPDPATPGPLTVNRVDYDAGDTTVGESPGTVYPEELRGSLHFPITGTGPFPTVLFLHGRHSTCRFAGEVEFLGSPCPGVGGTASIDSYKGYDYMAANLASHGYVVMSVNANGINTYDTSNLDAGANARSQVLAQSLDLLEDWNARPGPTEVDSNLVGKVDLGRIGMMGHSRGGEGVTDFIAYNRARPANAPANPDQGPTRTGLKAVLALAPIDAADQEPTGVAFGSLLPYCDGDVSDLSGTRPWERTKTDAQPRVQFGVNGADHNYFNTIWTATDNDSTDDSACSEDAATSARLSKDEQKRIGLALMLSFLRRYVGPEPAFDPYVTGEAPLPSGACPDSPVPCGEEVQVSYKAAAAERRAVTGAPTGTGLTTLTACKPADNGTGCPGTNRSTTDQHTVVWDGPSSLRWDAGGADVRGFETLTLRAAANHTDTARNTAGSQDFDVVLVDADGRRTAVRAAPYARGALVPSRGSTTQREVVLGGIRVPLTAFAGVDLAKVATVELRFADRGSIQVADVAFQEPARQAYPAPGTGGPTTPPTGTPGTDPSGSPPAGGGSSAGSTPAGSDTASTPAAPPSPDGASTPAAPPSPDAAASAIPLAGSPVPVNGAARTGKKKAAKKKRCEFRAQKGASRRAKAKEKRCRAARKRAARKRR